jgi:hypothetical protein
VQAGRGGGLPLRRAAVHALPPCILCRRVAAEPIAVILAVRDGADSPLDRAAIPDLVTPALDPGVPVTSVRYNGTIHDFVILNALRDTYAATPRGGEFLRATR